MAKLDGLEAVLNFLKGLQQKLPLKLQKKPYLLILTLYLLIANS